LLSKTADGRFFLRYVDGKSASTQVASFVGLPDPESFTGHGKRRFAATLCYIEDLLCSKMAIAEKIQVLPKDQVVGLSSSSETPNQVDSKTADQNKFVFDINVNVNVHSNI